MGSYIVRTYDNKYHRFSTVVMDQTTDDLDPEAMLYALTYERETKLEVDANGKYTSTTAAEYTRNNVSIEDAQRWIMEALPEGSEEWYYNTGGGYR